jgi:hypothetical protein
MIRHVEPTVITTPGGEEVFILTLTKSEWKSLQKQFEVKQPASKRLKVAKLQDTVSDLELEQAITKARKDYSKGRVKRESAKAHFKRLGI